jgi:hypothetical protein
MKAANAAMRHGVTHALVPSSPSVRGGPLAFLVLLGLLLSACGEDPVAGDPPPPQVAQVVVSPAAVTLAADSTAVLTATVLGPDGQELTDRAVTWSTSSSERATVSSTGEVRGGRILGGSAETATITATAGNRSGTATVTVLPVPAAVVELDVDSMTMMRGATRTLQASVRSSADEVLSGRAVTWSSSDEAVVRASGAGELTAVGPGTAAVRASVNGAEAMARVEVVDAATYAFPVALEAITYPWSYLEPSRPDDDVVSDPCALGLETLRVPAAFMGRHPLPELKGGPLRSEIRRGIGSKDVWQRGNPSFADGCSGDDRAEFLRTLDRVVALGGDYITLIPWTFIEVQAGEWSIVNPGELESSIVDDEDLRWAVEQARARGLKLHWINQIQGAFEGDHFFVPEGTRDNVARFFDAYAPYMLERAAFLEEIGVDAMQVSCNCWTVLEEDQYADLYEAALAALLPQIRDVFSGTLRMNAHAASLKNDAVRNNVDVLELSIAFGVHGLDPDALTMELAKSRYTTALQGEHGILASTGKPYILDLHAASRANYLNTDYLEETFCVSEFGVIWPSPTACLQREQGTDFSLQALLYAAKLEVIHGHPALNIWAVEARDYWMVDQLIPSSTFPNLAISPRNKPAEGVMKHWFRR